jgi:DNA-binding GntR family transcriptional regulator
MTSASVARPAPRRRASSGANSIVRTSSGEKVALHVRRRIFDGDLPPGTRVPQDEIAQELGVSRIPVREALIALEREGWVTIELHRGAFVNALDEGTIHDHYELFGIIYGFAAQRAVTRSNPEFVERLTAIQGQLTETDDPQRLNDLSIAFQRTIVEAASSPRIGVVLRAMSTLVPGNFFELVPEVTGIEKAGLAAILRAVRRADGANAAAEYGKMMRRIGDQVARLFKGRGLLDLEGASG